MPKLIERVIVEFNCLFNFCYSFLWHVCSYVLIHSSICVNGVSKSVVIKMNTSHYVNYSEEAVQCSVPENMF